MEVTENHGTTLVRAGINEKKFFERMGHLFASSFSVLGELMQNARRAGATRIDFTIDAEQKTLSIQDDGHGITDFAALIRLCDSAWSKSVVLEDKPFGMGLFSAFYSGESVDFLSNGKKLSMSLDDVISKRMLAVTEDQDAPAFGAVVRINGLKDKFLQTESVATATKVTTITKVLKHIQRLSTGFPVPVYVNGGEVDRPHAEDQMNFALTDIGRVSIGGIHRGDDGLTNVNYSPVTYLQGLPIGSRLEGRGVYPIVHLDSVRFIAKMPDRDVLFDAHEQDKVIAASLKNTARQFLVEQKASLSPEEMVRRYWNDCTKLEMLYLFNDIPWVPVKIFSFVASVQVRDDYESVFAGLIDFNGGDLISRQDVISGKLLAWMDTPSSADDDPWAVVCLKVMQSNGIYALVDKIDENHWLNELLPSTADMIFNVTTTGVSDQTENFSAGCSNHSVNIRLCDDIAVKITSETDAAFGQTYPVANNWILVPVFGNSDKIWNEEYAGFVCRLDKSLDDPVSALSSYTDSNEQYREEWYEENRDLWQQLVDNLNGAHLATIVQNAFPRYGVTFSDHQLPHMAICAVETFGDSSLRKLKVRAICQETFEALADAIGNVTVGQLQQAFDVVFAPGKFDPVKAQE